MRLINLLFMLLLGGSVLAQTPSAFKYQAVARDAYGNPIANQNIGLKIGILEGSSSGTLVYEEMHIASSNDKGLVSLEIGNGAILSGDMDLIEWTQNEFFLEISMDETGGTNYQLMGTSQLLSVPYALAAYETETVPDEIDVYSVDAVQIESEDVGANVIYIDSLLSLEPLATAPPNPLKGDVYFDDNNNTLRLYDGAEWQDMKHQGNMGPTFISPIQVSGISTTNGGWSTATLSGLIPSYAKAVILSIPSNSNWGNASFRASSSYTGFDAEGNTIIPITDIQTFDYNTPIGWNSITIHLLGYF